MRIRSVVPSLSLSLALVLHFADSAFAGPVEQLSQVALHPTDSKVMVLRYRDGGDGFFYSGDAGKSWALMCLSAIDINVPRSGPIAVTGDGHVMMGVFQGLYTDDAKGCGWEKDPFIGDVWVSNVIPDPTDSNVMFVATSKGGTGILNGIVKRDANGELSDFGKKEELLVTRLRVVEREGGLRFYESVLKGQIKVVINGMEMDAPNYLIRYSDDDAETFTEFPFGGTDGNLRLQARRSQQPRSRHRRARSAGQGRRRARERRSRRELHQVHVDVGVRRDRVLAFGQGLSGRGGRLDHADLRRRRCGSPTASPKRRRRSATTRRSASRTRSRPTPCSRASTERSARSIRRPASSRSCLASTT